MSTTAAGAILAKSHALFGRRISEDEYRKMARMRSVREIVNYLKNNTYFSGILQGVQENFVERAQIEQLLQQDLFERHEKLVKYAVVPMGNSVYDFFRWKEEILVILLAIRQVNLNDMQTYIANLPGYLVGRLSFDVMSLSKAKNQEELCQLLLHTPYYKFIAGEPRHGDGRFRVSWCEAALYQFYYDRIFAIIKKEYKGKDRTDLEKLYKREVEMLNTDMIYRFKRYFGGDSEEIRKRLIYKHDPRSNLLLEKMITASSAAEVLRLIRNTMESDSIEAVLHLAIQRDKRQFKNCCSRFYLTSNPDTAYVSYMMLGNMEIKKLTRVLEGVFYMEDPAAIEVMVI